MKIIFTFLLISSAIFSQENLIQFVNPFIGTDGHGHTFPGVSLPFGMVQLSPDTDNQGWDWCSGYHFSDSTLLGFSHTHLSGTGAGDYGDILLLPFSGKNYFNPGKKDGREIGYRTKFYHENEKASPGYYSVILDRNKIKVELTATERCGFHRYAFRNNTHKKLLIDLEHGIQDQATDTYFELVNKRTFRGYRRSNGWAKDHTIFFYAELNQNVDSILFNKLADDRKNSNRSKNLKVILTFENDTSNVLEIKIGISHTSVEGAQRNFDSEIKKYSFDEIRKQAEDKWENELSRIKVYTQNRRLKQIFYTALYHSFLAPNIQNDVDGNYPGMDSLIQNVTDRNQYTVFSLWDTFRALHPLINLLDEKRAVDFANSLLAKQKESGFLPVWELASNETGTMIGYHSVPVLSEMIMKNFSGFNYDSAFAAMKKSSLQETLGINYLKKMGFVPMDKEDDAVSRTIEYAYDDWCIAKVAKKLGYESDYKYHIQRAQNYKNVFDASTGFMRGRNFDGSWKIKFDPTEPFPLGAGEFTEGSSWQYSWYVPHDVKGLISLMGGKEKFTDKLDYFFNSKAEGNYYVPADVTGLIGQYAHGNEPSHHIAYLFNFVGESGKTQKYVRQIIEDMYSEKNDGLIGNEDCGQMSAWYIFSSLGFYPLNPVSNEYIIGSPVFDSAKVQLFNGNELKLYYKNQGGENIFVSSINYDGRESKKSFLCFDELVSSKSITFNMNNSAEDFGKNENDIPESHVDEKFIPTEEYYLFQPKINTNKTIFTDSLIIELSCLSSSAKIYYSFNKNDFQEYLNPIIINKTSLLNYYSKKDKQKSEIKEIKFIKALLPESPSDYPKLNLISLYSDKYPGTTEINLLNGIRASENFRDGFWQGFYGRDFEVIIDLGKEEHLRKITLGLLQNQGSWIFLPKKITLFSSDDMFDYNVEDEIDLGEPKKDFQIRKTDFKLELKNSPRYLKIVAKSIGNCPEWHNGNGFPSWIFADEIILEK